MIIHAWLLDDIALKCATAFVRSHDFRCFDIPLLKPTRIVAPALSK